MVCQYADYRGNVGVILLNTGQEPLTLIKGSRMAQMVLEKIATPDVEEVKDLDDSARGSGGFGSTGI